MGKSLLIVGAGSFATEVEEMARLLGYTDIGFLDDCAEKACCKPVVGSLSDIEAQKGRYENAIVAFGNNQMRLSFTKKVQNAGYTIPYLVHPTAYVSPDANLSEGCIVRAMAVVGRYVTLERACIVNVGGLIDHHCTLGEGTHVLMGAVVRNKVCVPPETWIASNQVFE